MASATTSTATMAAAGFDKRPASSAASSLATPGSGGFPSELRSPMVNTPNILKAKDSDRDLKTPITPPSAYLDYLKNMSPAMMSPMSTGTSARFSFHGSDKASETSFDKSISPPTSQPALSRNTSYDSNASAATTSTNQSAASSTSAASTTRQRPESPRVIIPPSPFAKPAPRSSRTPRRLHIPQSPFSAGMPSAAASLASAKSAPSPYSSTPLSAAPWSASFSPRDVDTEVNGKPGKLFVKQVVTRTFTYCRTPLEAVPDGNLWKRRKVEHEGTLSSSSHESSEEEPEFKEERIEEESAESSAGSDTTKASVVKQERLDVIPEITPDTHEPTTTSIAAPAHATASTDA